MKKLVIAAAAAVLCAGSAVAQDFNFKVTNNSEHTMAPLIVLDAAKAEPILFEDGKLSGDFVTTILEGDPRPMNGKIGSGVAGPVLGTSGPPGVMIASGETAVTDLFIESNTLRFYAKASHGEGEDTVISGVWDISMGGGTVLLNSYDIGHTEGTNEITLLQEAVVEVVITPN